MSKASTVKDKILYWGGVTLITTVVVGSGYYIYKSLFGSPDDDEDKKDQDSINNSFDLLNSPQINNNNISNQKPTGLIMNQEKDEKDVENILSDQIIQKSDDNNNINNINNLNKLDDNNQKEKSVNIFSNKILFLKSFGININEAELFDNSTNVLTEEGTVRLIININYLAEKFYQLDNPNLDIKRRGKINSNYEEYLTLCNETLLCKQNAYQIAAQKILESLKKSVKFEEFEKFLKNIEPKRLEELSIKLMMEYNNTLFKYNMDLLDSNNTKAAYIFYLKTYIDNANKIYNQKSEIINTDNNDDESNNIFIFQFMSLKMQMDDQLYEKYHIVDEHLKLLVNKYNLVIDNEIAQLQNEFDEINNKFGDFQNSQKINN